MDYQLPDLGEGIHEAELVEWRVEPGAVVREGEPLAEVMTDKATIELPAPFAGTIDELVVEPGATVSVGAAVLRYTPAEAGEESHPTKPPDEETTPVDVEEADPDGAGRERSPQPDAGERVSAAPAVRQLAAGLGVDLADITGSGPGGRVLVDDLTARLRASGTPLERDVRERRAHGPVTEEFGRPGTRVPFRGVRRRIAERLLEAQRTIPHYAYVDECDVTELVRLRTGLRETFEAAGLHLTYLPFFVRAVVGALREVPLLNASLDEESDEIVLHDRYDVGIATHTPRGLLVPVLRGADRLDLRETARRIERLAAEARADQLPPEALRDSTFTITSIGGVGGLISTPIINPPEVGILGIGRITKRPVYDTAGQLRPADMVHLSFCFDHRVVDGAIGAAFGNAIRRRLENPAPLLLGLEGE